MSRARVQAGGGLVEEDHRRPAGEARAEVQPAAHAARVRRDAAVGGLGEPEALEHLAGAGPRLGAGQTVEAADHLEVLTPGQLLVDGRELTGQTDPAAHRERFVDDVVAEHARAARCRAQQRGEDAHERRLAGAVGPEQPEDGGGLDLEVEAVERDDVAERLPDILGADGERAGHAASFPVSFAPERWTLMSP